MSAPSASEPSFCPFRNSSPPFVRMKLSVDSTLLPPLAALGSSTFKLAFTMAAEVSMKMTSNTSTMSTNGMMLIEDRTPSSSTASRSFAMTERLSSGLCPDAGRGRGRRGGHRARPVARLQPRQQHAPQRLAVRDGVLHAPAEDVVGDDRRDRDQEPHGRRHQRLGQ